MSTSYVKVFAVQDEKIRPEEFGEILVLHGALQEARDALTKFQRDAVLEEEYMNKKEREAILKVRSRAEVPPRWINIAKHRMYASPHLVCS